MEQWIWADEKASGMEVNENNGVVYLSWPALEKTGFIRHGFSTRIGGASQGIYRSMNLSYSRGDDPLAVTENFRRIAQAIGVPMESIVASDQTHTTNVRLVTAADKGSGVLRPKAYQDVDGMITNEPGVTLATFYADCVPLFFLDPVHKAIGLSHSGWRGTVGKIGKATIEAMTWHFGTKPADVLGAIGPSICQKCYEVSEDVIEQVKAAFAPKDWPSLFYQKENGKYQLDLWRANELVFLEAQLLPAHIFLPNVCTCCNPTLLFSHRASKGRRGNLGAFLMIKE